MNQPTESAAGSLDEIFDMEFHKNSKEVEMLRKRLNSCDRLQNFILDLSDIFIRMRSDKINEAIEKSLCHLCTSYDYEHSSIWIYNDKERTISCIYQWSTAQIACPEWWVINYDQVADLFAYEFFKKPVFVELSNEKLADLAFSASLIRAGSKGICVFPIMSEGRTVGGVVLATRKVLDELDENAFTSGQLYCTLVASVFDRLKQEDTYKESNDSNQLILDSINEGVGLYDSDGNVLFLNKHIIDTFGERIEVGKKIQDQIFSEMGDVCSFRIQQFQKVVNSGNRLVFDDAVGERLYCNKLYPILKDGQVSAVTVITEDITDKKRSEDLKREAQVLREKEYDYLQIIDGTAEASWIYDCERMTLKYSQEWRKRIGGENISDENMAAYIGSIIYPEDCVRIQKERSEIFEHHHIRFGHEYRVMTVSGEYIWALDQGKIIYKEDGSPSKVYGTTIDIDESKKALLALEALKNELASEVVALNRTEKALQESEQHALRLVDELKKADKNKNDFLSILSHELRNPLATIVTGLTLVTLTSDQQQRQSTLEILKRQTNQLTRLVDDLLDLTRINNNKVKLKKELTDFSALIENTVLDLRPMFEAKEIILETILTHHLFLSIDPIRIKQIIENLLYNALRYTDRNGKVTLSVRQTREEAVISVKDSGIGISPEMLPAIFEPFVQCDISLNRPHSGLGLGLAIVKNIAELHGGSIGATSEGLGMGSEFVLRLPLKADISVKIRETSTCEKKDCLNVLIIEDNVEFASVLETLLEGWGHSVELASTGVEGIRKARDDKPDMILCDIGLPRISGYQVAKEIIRSRTGNKPFLVALTGYATDYERQLALEAGFDLHIAKPVDIRQLRNLFSIMKTR